MNPMQRWREKSPFRQIAKYAKPEQYFILLVICGQGAFLVWRNVMQPARTHLLPGLASLGLLCGLSLQSPCGAFAEAAATDPDKAPRITILYDAFGKTSTMKKDWGFSAYIEYGGKKILFDTGNNADIFAHNVQAKGIDLTKLDFAIVSHRHGDHTSGLNYLLKVNPSVKIYAPQENFGVFGAALPGTFYPRNEALPPEMRYFDGNPPEQLRLGSPWPEANFTWISKDTEIAPGFHIIALTGKWGADFELREISLAMDTPEGVVLDRRLQSHDDRKDRPAGEGNDQQADPSYPWRLSLASRQG